MIKRIAKTMFYLCVAYMAIITMFRFMVYGWHFLYLPFTYGDEAIWQNASIDPWAIHDNKSPIFLTVNHILQIQDTLIFTRLFNMLIWLFIAVFIYDNTKKKESFLVLLIAVFNYPLIMFDSVFETLFIILAITYQNRSGLLVGLAGIFRPYAFVYTLVLKNKHRYVALSIGCLFSIILLLEGAFFPYLAYVTAYASQSTPYWKDYITFNGIFYTILLISLMVLSFNKDRLDRWVWGLAACAPLLLHPYEHYFMPPIIIFLYLWFFKDSEIKGML